MYIEFYDTPLTYYTYLASKLLKTGTSYELGRKDKHLVINSGKISHLHGEFIVGGYTADDVVSPTCDPHD